MGSVMSLEDVRRIVEATVRRHAMPVDDVAVTPMVDHIGDEALRVVLTLDPAGVGTISGEQAIGLLVDVSTELGQNGDDRFPYVEYSVAGEEPEADDEEISDGSL